MSEREQQTGETAQIGNQALWQVQNFVEAEAAAPVNPVKTVLRLMRGRWLKVVFTSAVCGIAFALIAFNLMKPAFESQGLVRLVAKEPKILYADNDDSRLRLYDAFVSAEATYLQSQQVLSRAHDLLLEDLDENGAAVSPPALKDLGDALTVNKLKGLISVTAKSADPAQSQRMVNALLRGYTDLQTRQSDSRQTLRARELEARVQELSAKQFALSEELLAIGEEYDASSLAKAHLTKVTQLEELDIRIAELTNTLVEMEASDGALDADTGDMEIKRATLLDRAMADMVFERAKRAAELEKLQLRYMPEHPKVATLAASLRVIDEAIETRRRLIATLGKTGAITGTDGAEKSQSLAELQALKRKLMNRRNDLSEEAKMLNSKLIQLKRINAEQSQISGMLAETRRILDQVLLESRNSMPGTIEILSRGSLPSVPASDKRKQFAALGLMAGAGMAAVIMLLLRQLAPTLTYSDDLAGSLPPSVEATTLPPSPVAAHAAAFVSDMQLHAGWRRDGTNVVSLTRFSDQSHIPATMIAAAAASQGLRTLLVCAAEDGAGDGVGFAGSVAGHADADPTHIEGYDYLGYGRGAAANGYSLQAARDWLQKTAQHYDLILIYSGVAERHYSTRIMPRLADISVAAVGPGDEKRLVRRFFSQSQNLMPLFVEARPEDPGLALQHQAPLNHEGDHHEKAA